MNFSDSAKVECVKTVIRTHLHHSFDPESILSHLHEQHQTYTINELYFFHLDRTFYNNLQEKLNGILCDYKLAKRLTYTTLRFNVFSKSLHQGAPQAMPTENNLISLPISLEASSMAMLQTKWAAIFLFPDEHATWSQKFFQNPTVMVWGNNRVCHYYGHPNEKALLILLPHQLKLGPGQHHRIAYEHRIDIPSNAIVKVEAMTNLGQIQCVTPINSGQTNSITLKIHAQRATIIPCNTILAKISFETRHQLFWSNIALGRYANTKEPQVCSTGEIGTKIFMVEDTSFQPHETKEVDTGLAIGFANHLRLHIKTAAVISELGLFTIQNISSNEKHFNHLRLQITNGPQPTKIKAHDHIALLAMEDLTNGSMVENELIQVFPMLIHEV